MVSVGEGASDAEGREEEKTHVHKCEHVAGRACEQEAGDQHTEDVWRHFLLEVSLRHE